jgi:hypothetical protein
LKQFAIEGVGPVSPTPFLYYRCNGLAGVANYLFIIYIAAIKVKFPAPPKISDFHMLSITGNGYPENWGY